MRATGAAITRYVGWLLNVRFRTLRQEQCVLDIDAEISNSVLDLGVASRIWMARMLGLLGFRLSFPNDWYGGAQQSFARGRENSERIARC